MAEADPTNFPRERPIPPLNPSARTNFESNPLLLLLPLPPLLLLLLLILMSGTYGAGAPTGKLKYVGNMSVS